MNHRLSKGQFGVRGVIVAGGIILTLTGTVYAAAEGIPGLRSGANSSAPPPPAKLHVTAVANPSVLHLRSGARCTTLGFTTTLRSKNSVVVSRRGKDVATDTMGWEPAGHHAYRWCVSRHTETGAYVLDAHAKDGSESASAARTVMVLR